MVSMETKSIYSCDYQTFRLQIKISNGGEGVFTVALADLHRFNFQLLHLGLGLLLLPPVLPLLHLPLFVRVVNLPETSNHPSAQTLTS